MATRSIVYIIFLFLTAVFNLTSGCTCFGEPAFCSLAYGIKGTITNIQGNKTANEDLIYSVQVSEVYRNSSEGIAVNDTIEINTTGSSAACGVTHLRENVTYLIAGDVMSRSYVLDSCSSVVLEFDAYDRDDGTYYNNIDIPCSASVTMSSTTTAVVVIFAVLNILLN